MTEQIDIPASFAAGADVHGKRVVITGAGRGLGRLLAHAFSQSGARVALVARTETDLKAVAHELPGASLVLAGDVANPCSSPATHYFNTGPGLPPPPEWAHAPNMAPVAGPGPMAWYREGAWS